MYFSFTLSAHANSKTQTNTETTAQTGEVVEMIGTKDATTTMERLMASGSGGGRTVARGGNYGLKNFNALDKNTTNVVANKNNAFSQTSPPAGQGASLKNVQDGKGSEERHGDKSEKENNRNNTTNHQDQDFYDRIQEGDRWR